jgi:hypothetical protein
MMAMDQFCMMASIILNMLSTLCLISLNSLSVRLWETARLLIVVSILTSLRLTICRMH